MGNKIQKSIMRWMNAPANTYPNIDKTFSRLQRLVMGDFVIKDFDQDETVSESEATFWVSDTRGSDENGNGSFESPFASIQKAIDISVEQCGHFIPKFIKIDSKMVSSRETYYPFVCRTKNITIEGVGGQVFVAANYPPISDGKGTLDSRNGCVFTNFTETGLADFVAGGGIDWTYVSDTFAWTGGNLFGHDLDFTLQTSVNSESWHQCAMNITLKNIYFLRVPAEGRNDLGPKTPAVAFLFGGTEIDDTVSITNIVFERCGFEGVNGATSYFSNNVDKPVFIECLEGFYSSPVVEINGCGFNTITPTRKSNPQIPRFIVGAKYGESFAGLMNTDVLAVSTNANSGLHVQGDGGSVYGDFIVVSKLNQIPKFVIKGNLSLEYGITLQTDGTFLIDNANTSVSIIKSMIVGSTFTNTSGKVNVYTGSIGDCVINGGTVTMSNATIRGNLTVADGATIDFTNVTVKGNVTLGSTSVVTGWKGGSYHGTLTDNGTHTFPAAGTLMNK